MYNTYSSVMVSALVYVEQPMWVKRVPTIVSLKRSSTQEGLKGMQVASPLEYGPHTFTKLFTI